MGERERPRGRNKPGISGLPDELDERLTEIESQIALLSNALRGPVIERPKSETTSWFSNLSQGVTLLAIISFAFWLGSFSNKVADNSAKIDKLYSVVLESRDSISSRLSGIETKLDAIDKKLSERRQTSGGK